MPQKVDEVDDSTININASSDQLNATTRTDHENASKPHVKSVAKSHITSAVTRNLYVKPAITLIGLVVSMAVCMLPYALYVVIIESGCQWCNSTDVLYALLLLQFCNACLDPFIYVFTRRKMRQFYTTCFCRCRIQTRFP